MEQEALVLFWALVTEPEQGSRRSNSAANVEERRGIQELGQEEKGEEREEAWGGAATVPGGSSKVQVVHGSVSPAVTWAWALAVPSHVEEVGPLGGGRVRSQYGAAHICSTDGPREARVPSYRHPQGKKGPMTRTTDCSGCL